MKKKIIAFQGQGTLDKREEQEQSQDMALDAESILNNLILEYMSIKKEIIMQLRQKRISEEEFMECVDDDLQNYHVTDEVRQDARKLFYQYIFGYYRLTELIDNPDVSDIHCIGYNQVRIKKKGKRESCSVKFRSQADYLDFIDRVATKNGVNISNLNAIQRFTDNESHPDYILRFTLVMSLLTTYESPYLIIRKVPKNFPEMKNLVESKMLSSKLSDELVKRFRSGSTLICGGNSAGKSTLLNALKETIPTDMAVMVTQQADELTTKNHPDMMFLHSLAETSESLVNYDLENISIAALTMDIDFFIIGEVKGAEAMYLLNAAYTGQLCAATVHSDSAQAAPNKIVDYALQAENNKYSREELLKIVASCFKTIIHVNKYQVDQVLTVEGWDESRKEVLYKTVYGEDKENDRA